MAAFKKFKDMKKAVSEAPGLIEQAQQMQAQAQQMQAAQMGAAQAGSADIDPSLLEPIAGISLERYAELSKAVGDRGLDQAGIESFMELQGHSAADWQAAYDGWNARFKGNMALSVQYGNLYQQARKL